MLLYPEKFDPVIIHWKISVTRQKDKRFHRSYHLLSPATEEKKKKRREKRKKEEKKRKKKEVTVVSLKAST